VHLLVINNQLISKRTVQPYRPNVYFVFIFYLTTLSVAPTIQRQTTGGIYFIRKAVFVGRNEGPTE
jgi:hypothetical protein